MPKNRSRKTVATLRHDEASRKNIPTAEFRSVMDQSDQSPVQIAYQRRNRDLDPQLVWRGKDLQDWSDLVVQAPPLFIQEKVHPKVLIDDLRRQRRNGPAGEGGDGTEVQPDLFADFNGLPSDDARTEFYQHDANWSNRMILGDSLQVMASLAEREGLRGKVQCIYLDPPYGIKFNSNFQWSTTSRDVKDGKAEHISREPEQVKAFRDTWRDGIHSYLTYLRDRLMVARELLADSGSIFVQIGDENVHRVRALIDEVFGPENLCAQITVLKTAGQSAELIAGTADYVLWYVKQRVSVKFRTPLIEKSLVTDKAGVYRWVHEPDGRVSRLSERDRLQGRTTSVFRYDNLTSQRAPGDFPVDFSGKTYGPGKGYWKTGEIGMSRLIRAGRIGQATNSITYIRYLEDFRAQALGNIWTDTGTGSFTDEKIYVVQSGTKLVQRCILMASDPGDLVLDPTCGSGTTAYVAEQWGGRWITIDTSRVALALARARIMGARYPYYLLADSPEGQRKEAEIARKAPSEAPTRGDVRQGFVYERVPHITLKSIANNAEIDVIWERWQETLEPLRNDLNARLDADWEEWQIPREASEDWPVEAVETHRLWWEARIARQQEIDASIAARADYEYLYDKPYEDNRKVRVAGPFTVESLSPHRVLAVDEDDELIDRAAEPRADYGPQQDFAAMILEQLATAGVQQAHKEDRIAFVAVTPWPGEYICAEGRYREGDGDAGPEKRAGIFVGPEFGTVARPDLVAAAREAGDAGFDVLIGCAFNYEAHASEFNRLGRIPVLKARMNADLHMADELKNTGKGNLFVIFGEPDIDILPVGGEDAGGTRIQVRINGVDVFHPTTGEVRSDGADGIACWFIDTDYNEESFFVRHAYFLGANDPYKALKTTLKAQVDADAWASLHSDLSRPFDRPASGRIAVKVINHLGDEVMKVFRV
ncbi:MAG: site-specific DNA-methyltransferase [Acidobacteria bacterium]|nr:site-specific DNA-methyltransferase [Acidobacteriota bacterium]